jgi:glycosyltransferase involved in cell wall biosynthesis
VFAHGRRDGETFGTVFAEAMMHGRVCLSHWSPVANAQPEAMGPGGLFAEGEDDYAEKLEQLFSDQGMRERLAAKGRTHARRYYSLESCVSRLEHLYERLSGAPDRAIEGPIPYADSIWMV